MNKVRRARGRAGLTQGELAEISGISEFTISEIENSRREPRVATLFKLADALGVDVDDILEEREKEAV